MDINVSLEEVSNINVSLEGFRIQKIIDLVDGENQYSNGKFLQSTENGWQWTDIPGGGDMLRSIYDANENNIVDMAEGIRTLSSFPQTSKPGDLIVVNGDVYIKI